mmetsp:Transcript_4396/g.12389  ORF Transcript_4396/g.12389 Transcript_4396/m.12389 type:complete len:301 (+) Transcript_4396:123-1025(+)
MVESLHDLYLIHESQRLSGNFHSQKAGGVRGESSNHRWSHTFEQCRWSLLFHQMTVNVAQTAVHALGRGLVSTFQDIRRDCNGPAGHTSESTRSKHSQWRQRAGIRIDALQMHQLLLYQLICSEPSHTARHIAHQRQDSATVQTTNAPLLVDCSSAVHHTAVLALPSLLHLIGLHLEQTFDPLAGRHGKGGGDGTQSTGHHQLRDGKFVRFAGIEGCRSIRGLDGPLTHIVSPKAQGKDGGNRREGSRHAAIQARDALLGKSFAQNAKGRLLQIGRLHPHLDQIERMADRHDAGSSDTAR